MIDLCGLCKAHMHVIQSYQQLEAPQHLLNFTQYVPCLGLDIIYKISYHYQYQYF